jgi:hypothetical protein
LKLDRHLLPLHVALVEVNRGRLAILPLDLPWLKVTFAVMHLAHRPPSPAGAAFVERVHEADRNLLAEETHAAAALARAWRRKVIKPARATNPHE